MDHAFLVQRVAHLEAVLEQLHQQDAALQAQIYRTEGALQAVRELALLARSQEPLPGVVAAQEDEDDNEP